MQVIRVALIGNPNVGKSVIFNNLTGMRQHVGNWPGKTVEKKMGECVPSTKEGEPICHLEITDLPGTYSLTARAVDELIARNFIINEKPDIIVDIVDATNLERNLYLTTLLIELEVNVVVALNMWDLAQDRGIEINVNVLSEELGVPVIPTIAIKKVGMEDLIQAIIEAYEKGVQPKPICYSKDMEADISRIEKIIQKDSELIAQYPSRWLAIKILENDSEILQTISHRLISNELLEVIQ